MKRGDSGVITRQLTVSGGKGRTVVLAVGTRVVYSRERPYGMWGFFVVQEGQEYNRKNEIPIYSSDTVKFGQ